MSRLIYGLSGEGRGHTSRAQAVASQLRQRGHQVRFCCGGVARTVLERTGEEVIPVPPLEHVLEGNELQFWQTVQNIWPELTRAHNIIDRLCDAFEAYEPALVITDFETFSTRAAERLGIPVLSLNHQQIITEGQYQTPLQDWLDAGVARVATRFITPRNPTHTLVTSFFDVSLKRPNRTTLVPPILRSDVRSLDPEKGDHVLVYYNHGAEAGRVLQALNAMRQEARIYGFPDELAPELDPDLTLRSPSRDGFLKDLATCRAVLSTAGFTLLSEALYLGKPILAVPNGGIFEQTLNAHFLSELGLGESAEQETLTANSIRAFLDRAERYRSPCASQVKCGTQLATDHIERTLGVAPSHPLEA